MGSCVKCLPDTLRFLGGKADLRGLVVVVLLLRVGAEDVRDNFARTVVGRLVAVDFVVVNAGGGGAQSNTNERFIVIVIMKSRGLDR